MNLSLWTTLIKAMVIPIIGIFIAGKFNVFDYISFIPKDQSFKVAITAYFAILECIYAKLSEVICKHFKASVECLFYCDKQSKSINNSPQLTFIEDVAYIHCSITIKGWTSKLAKNSLIISFPNWVGIQNVNNSIGKVNNKNQLTIDFAKMISVHDKLVEDASVDIKIGLIKNPSNDEYSKTITPSLSKKFMYKLAANKFTLRNR